MPHIHAKPILALREALDKSQFGGKAANLAALLQAGLPVPDGLAIGLAAFSGVKLNDDARRQIQTQLKENELYAVRSSALAEDAKGASWAGQFESFLNIHSKDVLSMVEKCHNSTKSRAKAYAKDKSDNIFNIAVVVQEMIQPEYAGVLFTKDPISGESQLITEYVEGLGEELVSGRADPKLIVIGSSDVSKIPFDTVQLAELVTKTELVFGVPQDIEWVSANGKIWLVQARPITTTQADRSGYYLGEPNDLFYWGPSRAKPVYMGDFLVAIEQLFTSMSRDPSLPKPPKTMVLFNDNKMVWLNNAQAFSDFTQQTFVAYEKLGRLEQDIASWRAAVEKLNSVSKSKLGVALVEAWVHTELAEFSLYGAETVLIDRLERFDAEARQEIWNTFTVPDKKTFLMQIDTELAATRDPVDMAKKYPWIQDGYDGLSTSALEYFTKRLVVLGGEVQETEGFASQRDYLKQKLALTDKELSALTLARKLAEFMDERKAWMMQTRKLITEPMSTVTHGWYFNEGEASLIDKDNTDELWQRYVGFKSSTSAVAGVVASNGGRHFMHGEVVIVGDPTNIVEDGKIIVVPSTSPSYVPLMRVAKALVTDHGGMMSHAAIVAREFNLPCIVGTKQATKVLKTGDKVVLDLITGEINR